MFTKYPIIKDKNGSMNYKYYILYIKYHILILILNIINIKQYMEEINLKLQEGKKKLFVTPRQTREIMWNLQLFIKQIIHDD